MKKKPYRRLTLKQKLTVANIANKEPEDICKEYGISLRTYQRIKNKYGTPNSLAHDYHQLKVEYHRLEEHCQKEEEKVKILQESKAKYSDDKKEKLAAADELYPKYHPSAIIDALGISRGGFYNCVRRNKKEMAWWKVRRREMSPLILKLYNDSHCVYGAQKIAALLKKQGYVTSERVVGELMKELDIHGVENRRSRRISKKAARTISRLINQFEAYEPNVLWVTDFTELKLDPGDPNSEKTYLCVYLDIYSRMIVGYSFSSIADTKFVEKALQKSLENRNHPKYLLIHSDQGTQYTSMEFQGMTDELGIVRSFSRRGKPADNPVAEAFFSVMKREEYRRNEYDSIPELKAAIERYIKWYNTERVHSALDYMSPKDYEEKRPKRTRRTNVSGL